MRLRSSAGIGFGALAASVVGLMLGACGSSDDSHAPATDAGGVVFEGGSPVDGPGPGDGGACPSTGMGSVSVTVTGLPVGAAAKVSVQGAPEVKSTSTIVVSGGMHAIAASVVTSPDPIVRGVYLPTVSATSLCVTNGGTASVTVAYTKVPASHSLWASALTPAIQLQTPPAGNLEEIAFDESGGLWFTFATGQVARFAPAQLGASAEPTPATVVTGTVVGSTKALAFFPAPAALPLYSALPQ